MKIYADENIENSIIEGLRRRKIEIVSAGELGFAGKPDEFQNKKASRSQSGRTFFYRSCLTTTPTPSALSPTPKSTRVFSEKGMKPSIRSRKAGASISMCLKAGQLGSMDRPPRRYALSWHWKKRSF